MDEDELVERISLAKTIPDPALETDDGGRPNKAAVSRCSELAPAYKSNGEG